MGSSSREGVRLSSCLERGVKIRNSAVLTAEVSTTIEKKRISSKKGRGFSNRAEGLPEEAEVIIKAFFSAKAVDAADLKNDS